MPRMVLQSGLLPGIPGSPASAAGYDWFRLDELPQLVNILKGEMSLIGPRAEWDIFACDSIEKIVTMRPGRRASDPPGTMVPCGSKERIPYFSFRTIISPGITGWAQVMFPYGHLFPPGLRGETPIRSLLYKKHELSSGPGDFAEDHSHCNFGEREVAFVLIKTFGYFLW